MPPSNLRLVTGICLPKATPESGTGYHAIKTKFKVPTVTTGPGNQYSSDWVGIGGFNTGDLVQDGIEADNLNGTAHYLAWTEILPASEVPLSLVVHPGDVMKAIVKETAANTWVMKVKNLTTVAHQRGGRPRAPDNLQPRLFAGEAGPDHQPGLRPGVVQHRATRRAVLAQLLPDPGGGDAV